jgi:hypothetical protein
VPEVRFAIEPYDFRAAERLSAELGVSPELAQILVRRGHVILPRPAGSWPLTRRTRSTRSAASRRRRPTILAHADRASA